MNYIRDYFPEARLKAILELEREQKSAYIPAKLWTLDLTVIERADLSQSTKAGYRHELKALLDAGIDPFDFDALMEYAVGLKPTNRMRLKRALRLICLEYDQSVKENATPENLSVVQALILRLDAMRDTVKVNSETNSQNHIWLTPSQVQEITSLCGKDIEGKRDWIILSLLLGAGLRRAELNKITFDALRKERTKSGKRRNVLYVTGYGGKDRIVPISPLLAKRLREWEKVVGGGNIARSYEKRKLGQSLSGFSVHQIVRKYGIMIGVPNLKTDDLSRTYAQFAFDSGLTPAHIKELMGHVRLSTTQRHLNLKVDLGDISGDFVPLKG